MMKGEFKLTTKKYNSLQKISTILIFLETVKRMRLENMAVIFQKLQIYPIITKIMQPFLKQKVIMVTMAAMAEWACIFIDIMAEI